MLSKIIAVLLFLASVQAIEYTPATSYSSINRYGSSTKPLPAINQVPVASYQTAPAVATFQAIKPLEIQPPQITSYHSAPAATPVATYHAPTTAYHSTPIATYHSTPVAAYHSAPTTAYHSTPIAAYHSTPATGYHPAPAAAYHSSPVAAYHSAPGAAYHSTPVAAYHTSPVTTFHTSPVTTFHSAPVAHYHTPIHSVNTLIKPTQLTSLQTGPAVTTVLSKSALVQQPQYPIGRYEFEYGVQDQQTGDIKRHHEIGDEGIVKGEYSLLQPDGITRTVTYSADDHSGFNAKVEYSGHSTHPVSKHEAVKPLVLH